MTEGEWLSCSEPEKMLAFLGGKASQRKLRLFAAACCRRIWHALPDEGCRLAVAVIERCANGLAGRQELEAALAAAEAVEATAAGPARAARAVTAPAPAGNWSSAPSP